MRTLQLGVLTGVAVSAMLLTVARPCLGQTNLNFNAIRSTPEGTIQISWNSTSHETYEIDEADTLTTNAQGTITWNQMDTEYPSQGTNTLWLDCGNYLSVPAILNPKYTTNRFYRIVDLGPDTTSDEPVVMITNLVNGSTVSDILTVTVAAETDQSFLTTKLYVDGQEQNDADVSTNWTDSTGITNYALNTYYLNTCEWLNGPHTIFASARCQNAAAGPHDTPTILIGHSVSSFVSVNFTNLITGISFTQPFFAPEDGTTQQVSATFAANVNWTLQIQDINTNTVRTATGSGGTMLFDWDGTGTGETNLPVGNYTYLISAVTNGLPLPDGGSGGGSGGSGPPSPDFAESRSATALNSTQLWAQPSDGTGLAVPLVIIPPGFDTNGFDIFEEPLGWSPETATAASAPTPSSIIVAGGGSGGFSPDYSGASSQGSRAPVRPPNKPVLHRGGTCGVAYQMYQANGTNGYTLAPPVNGEGLGPIPLEGNTAARSYFNYGPRPQHKSLMDHFILQMWAANWSSGFVKVNDQLSINDLKSSGANVFNNVQLGLLLLHGTYSTTQDWTENGAQEIYFPITSGTSAQYLRISDMNLGSSATNGLKWMANLACNSMRQGNWTSMRSYSRLPYNSNLHLFLGANSTTYDCDYLASEWAKDMTIGPDSGQPIMTVESAWYAGSQTAYKESGYKFATTIIFADGGDANCRGDYLQTNSSPTGTYFYHSQQVYP